MIRCAHKIKLLIIIYVNVCCTFVINYRFLTKKCIKHCMYLILINFKYQLILTLARIYNYSINKIILLKTLVYLSIYSCQLYLRVNRVNLSLFIKCIIYIKLNNLYVVCLKYFDLHKIQSFYTYITLNNLT